MGRLLLKFKRIDIKTFIGELTGHFLIGRHVSRLRTPYSDCCKNGQEVEKEDTI